MWGMTCRYEHLNLFWGRDDHDPDVIRFRQVYAKMITRLLMNAEYPVSFRSFFFDSKFQKEKKVPDR